MISDDDIKRDFEYSASVFIGRFQPFHNGHLEIVNFGLEKSKKVILLIGSAYSSRNVRNPWTYQERENLILSSVEETFHKRVIIEPIGDAFYSENTWIASVQNIVSRHTDSGSSIAIIGNFKDQTSHYLKSFPQWEFLPVRCQSDVDASTIRAKMFGEQKILKQNVPPSVSKFLKEMLDESRAGWSDYPKKHGQIIEQLIREFHFLNEYKKKHKWADAEIKYPPVFTTVDSVVISAGHILIVKRKSEPGQGLLALPGGFLRATETIEDAAIRELKEETGIALDKNILRASIFETKVFDHPERSLRGRTITHAHFFRLEDGQLPAVSGQDDAQEAFWMPISDVARKENEFYEDHAHIIQYFMKRN